jgi:hypothetical protein
MANVTTHNIAIDTPAAPLERGIGSSFEYTDLVQLDCSGKNEFDGPLEDLVSHRLEGTGKVDLIKIVVKYQATDSGARIYLGTSAVGSSAQAKSLAMNGSGHAHSANAFNSGSEHIFDLVPLANVSRQIRPASTNLPMLRLVYEKTAYMNLSIHIYMKVEGVRVHNDVIANSIDDSDE